jgi:cobalt-zinc-cadmium efflux system membrane fusion protein
MISPGKRLRRRWPWPAVVAVAACGPALSPSFGTPKAAEERPAGEAWITQDQALKSIAITPAERRTLNAKVISSGRVTFDDAKVSHVFSPVTGRIEALVANVGDQVKAGAPLCTINSPDLGSAFSDAAKARADLAAAEHDLKRKKDLYEVHAGTQSDLEQAEDNYLRAKAEMERASLKTKMWKVSRADAERQRFTLRSPLDGMVLMRNANPGIEVQGIYSGANIANELFTVGDYSSVWVYIDLYEVDLALVRKGQDVVLRSVSYPGEAFKGQVSLVAEVIDPSTRTARVRCDIANPQRQLKPEMYVTAEISTGTKETMAVPRTAVQRLADQTVVFIQIPEPIAGAAEAPGPKTARFKAVPVQTGQEDDQYVEILGDSLKVGDAVVTKGGVLLSGAL